MEKIFDGDFGDVLARDASGQSQVADLLEAQLALVGGGIGDTVL